MMLEDMLAYRPGSIATPSFAELLAADLDDDARTFHARMTADLALVAASNTSRSPAWGDPGRTLLAALAAAPGARETFWRRFYREVTVLAAECRPENARQPAPPELAGALERLRGFLFENRDMADGIPRETPPETGFGLRA